MAPTYNSRHAELVAAIAAAAKGTPAQRRFIEHFYALSPVSDLEQLEPARAAGIALACERFLRTRKPGQPKLAVEQIRHPQTGRIRTGVFVLNDDMPFLVDSLSSLFTSLGLTIHLILHPIFAVDRDKAGKLAKVERLDEAALSLPRESLIYVELSPLPVTLSAETLSAGMEDTLSHIYAGVADWRAMRARVLELAREVAPAKGKSTADKRELQDLLTWLASNHFVFLGIAEYRLKESKTEDELVLDRKSALGIYRLPGQAGAVERGSIPTASTEFAVLKASEMSRVHRRVHMDYIVLRRTDKKGRFLGETRLLGLFTSTVYYREVEQIPLLRTKVARVMARAGFSSSSHSGKALKTALEFLPREELFQMDEESLFSMAMRIVSLDAKPQVRLFLRLDPFERFVSAMVYVPRERLSTELREQIIRVLEVAYGGRVSNYAIQVTESPLSRVTVEVETTPGTIPEMSVEGLESQIAAFASVWSDALHDALIALAGEDEGQKLTQSFAHAFPPAYVNTHSGTSAAHDIRRIQDCVGGDGLALELFRRNGDPANQLHLKCFTRDLNSELSGIIPLLEHMGCTVIDATPYVIAPAAAARAGADARLHPARRRRRGHRPRRRQGAHRGGHRQRLARRDRQRQPQRPRLLRRAFRARRQRAARLQPLPAAA
ncbi:MAG: hypothetical protein WDN72_00495 [Alphaproteobacteria bacterium]